MKNRDVVRFFNAKEVLERKRLPMRLAFALKINYEKLQIFANTYNEQFMEIRKRYEDETGCIPNQTEEDKKLLQKFLKETEELYDMEINAEGLQKVDEDDLEKCDLEQFDVLTVGDLEAIGFMIE